MAATISTSLADDSESRLLFDFQDKSQADGWTAVNDGVMGGLSEGGPEMGDGVLIFSGELSLENNGSMTSPISLVCGSG